ncbi:MAG: hypothetical protein IKG82_07275 [Oscillospiraceae bacterium]|nr:hypothetical protein [Oscillospiraceae bacterium]
MGEKKFCDGVKGCDCTGMSGCGLLCNPPDIWYPLRGCNLRMGAALAGSQAHRALERQGVSHSAECDEGSALDPQTFEKV